MFTAAVNGALSRLGLDPRGTAPFPSSTAPMLMHKASRLVSSPDWLYEPKWDGFRVIATVHDGSVRLLSRNGHSLFRRPLEERRHILQELRPALAGDAVQLTESFSATE